MPRAALGWDVGSGMFVLGDLILPIGTARGW
jgi:hypothetical protein